MEDRTSIFVALAATSLEQARALSNRKRSIDSLRCALWATESRWRAPVRRQVCVRRRRGSGTWHVRADVPIA